MTAFATPVDIANRALQHVGALRITAFTDTSRNAAESGFLYDKDRTAELRRAVWRFAVRRVALRAITSTTKLLSPVLYDSLTAYGAGAVTVDASGAFWRSLQAANTGVAQSLGSTWWEPYYGPLTGDAYSASLSYYAGEIVTAANAATAALTAMASNSAGGTRISTGTTTGLANGDSVTISGTTNYNGTFTIFNLVASTSFDIGLAYTANDAAGTYAAVTPTAYISLVNDNKAHTPSSSSTYWLSLGGATADLVFFAPLQYGPDGVTTKGIFRLPYAYLRAAPQDFKQPSVSVLNTSAGLRQKDWEFTGNYLLSNDEDPILFSFVMDVQDVTQMTGPFCEGLAARMGFDLNEILTQDVQKSTIINKIYQMYIMEARKLNIIESGSTEQDDLEYDPLFMTLGEKKAAAPQQGG